ncbi:MAG: uL15 family ribosomal protein [Candidatus Aenigmarchaeota archaeon]|nr:uL15 family ribosomal protein [Candidatus Aenigmarchaeota archaeon]
MGKKKTKKMRGKKTFGYGSKKKHRGGGSRGGRGLGGAFKHKKTMILKENPEHFGKRGFKRKNKKIIKTINLKELDELYRKSGEKSIDVSKLGYDKVLGNGKLTNALEIKSKSFSQMAKKKIEKVGGKIIELL